MKQKNLLWESSLKMLIHCAGYLLLACMYTAASSMGDYTLRLTPDDYVIIKSALLVAPLQLMFMLVEANKRSGKSAVALICIVIVLFFIAYVLCWQLISLCLIILGIRRIIWKFFEYIQNRPGDFSLWKNGLAMLLLFFGGAWLVQYTQLNYLALSYAWWILLSFKMITYFIQLKKETQSWTWAL